MLLSSSHRLPWALTPLATDRPSRRALAQPLRLPHLGGCPALRDHALRSRTRTGTRRRAVHRHYCSPRRLFVWTAPSTYTRPLRPRGRNRNRHARTTPRRSSRRCEGLSAPFVIASKMSVRSKALGVENDLRGPVGVQ